MGWTLISSATISSPTPAGGVVFTGLDIYQDLVFVGEALTLASSGFRTLEASVNGGSTWLASNIVFSAAGTTTTSGQIAGHNTGTTSARSIFAHIIASNTALPIKPVWTNIGNYSVTSASPVDALRISGNGGAIAITGGAYHLYGRT